MHRLTLPSLSTDAPLLNRAFRIAMGDVVGNICPYHAGLLREPAPALMAGLEYDRPWTRDSAINAWNGIALLMPEVARNTLRAVLKQTDWGVQIGGQYWDAMIWTMGAWQTYLVTGYREWLALAYDATVNSLARFERDEFNPDLGLFWGPACYGDGVAAYPEIYAETAGGSSGILDWPAAHPDLTAPRGYGIPMHALSTNCLYYQAYVLAKAMAQALDHSADAGWARKARALKAAINRHFWDPARGHYRYLVDPFGGSDHQEGLGHAFALLFGVAEDERAAAVLRHQHVTPSGVPCLWPTFPRYEPSFGRHSGTVWPHVQGFWAAAALAHGENAAFDRELNTLAAHACRDAHFAEIYHPHTGKIYGGLQEDGERGIREWHSCSRQTWSATAFLRMVLEGLVGLRLSTEGLRIEPYLPEACRSLDVEGLRYREMTLTVRLKGRGTRIVEARMNGNPVETVDLPADRTGAVVIEVHLGPARG